MAEALESSFHLQGMSILSCANPGFTMCVDSWVSGPASRSNAHHQPALYVALLASPGSPFWYRRLQWVHQVPPGYEAGFHGDAVPPALPSRTGSLGRTCVQVLSAVLEPPTPSPTAWGRVLERISARCHMPCGHQKDCDGGLLQKATVEPDHCLH